MDHPRLLLGNIRFRPQWLRNKLYDIRFHHLNRAVSANGTHVAAQLNVAPELQRREGLLNARIWLSSIFPGEGTAAAEALVRMKHRLHAKVDPHHSFLGDLFTMARQPANTGRFQHVVDDAIQSTWATRSRTPVDARAPQGAD